MFFIRTQIGDAGVEFAKTDDALHLFPPMGGLKNAQAFAHNSRGAPTQFADQNRESFS
jgi:hypothetical protein